MALGLNPGASFMAPERDVIGMPTQGLGMAFTNHALKRVDMFHAGEWVSSLTTPLVVTQQWDFVNITDPKQRKDKKIQRLVRVKAQKHVRKCQRQEQDAKSVSPESKCPSEAASARHTPSPLGQLTLRDPGMPSNYPIPMKPYMRALLDRFVHTDLGTFADIIPMRDGDVALNPLKIQWLSFAVSDPALLHATILVSSIRVPRISGEDITSRAILHQSQTIALVNQAIRGEREVDDGIIAAVVGLTGYECVHGNYEAWRVHMNGLEALVKARGGLKSCGWLLRRMVYIIDHVGAILVAEAPRFPLGDDSSIPSNLFSRERGKVGSADLPYIGDDITIIFNDVRVLVSLLGSSDAGPAIHWARRFLEKRESIEYRLVSFYHGENRWTDGGKVDECCRLALLLFMNMVARRLSNVAPVIINVTAQLRTALLDLGRIAGSIELRKLLFWILFAGGKNASGLTREWFVAKLKELSGMMNVVLWTDCKRILRQLVWYGSSFEDQCRSFWLEAIDSDEFSGTEI